ncbi:hypothetical protein [Pleionea sediminis]|uniref:hypothetical protein n=1 Tax=Pleionea sediminis TaxID=2569479 RepID=UPI0013DDDDC6|nr:hypothetical protein [Pleionea sediminis]
MARPDRIEYEDATYHVMNRGRGRQMIFHDEDYYKAFETTLLKQINVLTYIFMLTV